MKPKRGRKVERTEKTRVRRRSTPKASGVGRPLFPHKLTGAGGGAALFVGAIGDAYLDDPHARGALEIARLLREIAADYPFTPDDSAGARFRATNYAVKRVIHQLVETVQRGHEAELADALVRIYRSGADRGDLYPWIAELRYAWSDAMSESGPNRPTVSEVQAKLSERGHEIQYDALRKELSRQSLPVAPKFAKRTHRTK